MVNEVYQVDFKDLTPLIQDDDITDIMYSDNEVWYTSISKGLVKSDIMILQSDIEVMCNKLAVNMNEYFNRSKPYLDAEFDELRINAIHQGNAPSGVVLAIRKTPKVCRINQDQAIKDGYATKELFELLAKLVRCRCNILISGETGTGKTELVKFLYQFANPNDRAITIEDTLELHLKHLYPRRNIISLKESKSVGVNTLVRSCLRQNPDWILVSESRGNEVSEMLNTIATGHSIITTLHSESAKLIPLRISYMTNSSISLDSIYQLIDIGIHLELNQMPNGRQYRYISEVVEFDHINGNNITSSLYSVKNKNINEITSTSIRSKVNRYES